MQLLQQMIILFILMLAGYISYKKQLITEETCNKLSAIVLQIANPAMIISASIGTDAKIRGSELALTLALAVGINAVMMVISYFVPILLRVEKKSYGVYRAMTSFSNIGFMGLPIISAVFGNAALLHASLFLLPFNALIYTYGISAMRQPAAEKAKFSLAKVLNAGVLACLVSLAIYLTGLHLPAFVSTSIRHMSNLSVPLSMMVIGASLATTDLKKLFTDLQLLAFSAIKLLVIPVVGMLIIKTFIHSENLMGVCLIMLATPVGSMTAMLAQQYGGDYELSARGVALTTILSVVTIPMIWALVF